MWLWPMTELPRPPELHNPFSWGSRGEESSFSRRGWGSLHGTEDGAHLAVELLQLF